MQLRGIQGECGAAHRARADLPRCGGTTRPPRHRRGPQDEPWSPERFPWRTSRTWCSSASRLPRSPKDSAAAAVAALKEYGVAVKVLTGDNDAVTRSVCGQVGLRSHSLLLGSDVEAMDDAVLRAAAERTDIFAKLTPQQKARIVTCLRENGHTVGFMGDGINDAAAMKASDVGISVDSAVDIARESADIILLEKDLMVLEQGAIEGRRIYANIIKYIKMTASSNFGNMFSVLAASAFLPFLPLAPLQILVLNLIYEISCTAMPWTTSMRIS
ncbi:MAG: HAD-IC family P-type ATPase [Bilophila wadsworthia]